VEVRHDEGVAIRIDPESCAASREGCGEALTGEHAGQPLSRERSFFGVPTVFKSRKATWSGASARAPDRLRVVVDPGMHGRFLYGNREISDLTARLSGGGPHREGEEP
jgi:hypothetical protein